MKYHILSWADPEGGPGNHKSIGFLSNTGPDPLENHQATKPAFNVGPSSARQRKRHLNGILLVDQRWLLLVLFRSSILHSSTKKTH